ncbi:MAG: phospholipase C, phosphocholine-specific [Verrucomicrobiae bacterium]|nr:phospholipase C, phosphocholine-specific [Verrucomicrobiae bacterium]
MNTRRQLLKKSMLLTGLAGWDSLWEASVARAASIGPVHGSTYRDAEHVVVLMQENRSFDHCFGTLKGVRGFNDPHPVPLPNGNPVWLQSNATGETYAPFRFDIKDTKITWMGDIPHSRSSQVDASNLGKHDGWLESKRPRHKAYADHPLTMGYYTRDDIPFNYALADAFTVCDQNFCSAMTSTWPNRLLLWSGTVRGSQTGTAKAYIRNDIPDGEACWTTFPELLERNGISWRVYQNDLTAGGGFSGEERSWLSNFGCNLLEHFAQYQVQFSPRYVQGLKSLIEQMPREIAPLKERLKKAAAGSPEEAKLRKDIDAKEKVLADARAGLLKWSREAFEQLSPEERSLHEKAFVSNAGDPDFHSLTTLTYDDDGEKRELEVPKGDVLHQFREDVRGGRLPTVSWLVGPQKFSDHPSAPWYGSWYVSEILDILTENPKVWEKTIFILTYDENDGYFDHIPPFVAPDPSNPESGKCSPGIDTASEYIRRDRELEEGVDAKEAREGPVGLGFRVPMVIASPWTRGGRVCSQVFDHTSVFRFIQSFINEKEGRPVINESNVSLWRKTVSGDLTSAFQANAEDPGKDGISPLERDAYIQSIYNAKFKSEPARCRALSAAEVTQIARDPSSSLLLPHQEPGIKPSCALPYQIYAEARLGEGGNSVRVRMEARSDVFGERSVGSPFTIFTPGRKSDPREAESDVPAPDYGSRSYAVIAGEDLDDTWKLDEFGSGIYHLRVYGPNGFVRVMKGSVGDPGLEMRCEYEQQDGESGNLSGNVRLMVRNLDSDRSYTIEVRDRSYGQGIVKREIPSSSASGGIESVNLDLSGSHAWYDFTVKVDGFDTFARHYAGHVETGRESFSDPQMGRVV